MALQAGRRARQRDPTLRLAGVSGPERAGRLGARLGRVSPPLLLVAVGLALWQWQVEANHLAPEILPTPWRVATQGWAYRADIWQNTVPTLEETGVGFLFSLACSFALATGMDFSGWCRRALYPLLVASQTLPMIAIAPLLIIWFGFGLTPKVIVVALVTFFPVTVALTEGFESAEPDAVRLLRSMGAGRLGVFLRLRLPGSMPYFFAGLRIAITYAVVGAVFAEYVGAYQGLGIYMQEQKNNGRTDLVLAAVVVTAAVSVALFGLTYLLQRLAIPWYRLSRQDGGDG